MGKRISWEEKLRQIEEAQKDREEREFQRAERRREKEEARTRKRHAVNDACLGRKPAPEEIPVDGLTIVYPGPLVRQAIRDYRRQHNLSFSAFGRQAGVSKESLTRIESGARNVAVQRMTQDRILATIGFGTGPTVAQPPAKLTDLYDMVNGEMVPKRKPYPKLESDQEPTDQIDSEWAF